MKKIFSLFIIFVVFAVAKADIRYVEGSFRSTNAADISASGNELGRKSMTSAFVDYLPVSDGSYDDNGQPLLRGIVRIAFENLSNEDIRDKVTVHAGNFAVSKPTYLNNPATGSLECWVQIDPYTKHVIDITVDGIGSTRIPNLNIQGKHMYTLDIESDETVTVSFTSNVDNTQISLDNQNIGYANVGSTVKKERVQLGKHKVTAKTPSGETKTFDIDVSKSNSSFPIDMKRRYTVHFTSNEKGVRLYENGNLIADLPASVEVPEGPHSYIVKKYGYIDVPYNVNIISNGEQSFNIYKTKAIDFYSLQNNSDFSGASVYINNSLKGTTPLQLDLPYGSYNVKMSYYGREKSGKLSVSDGTPTTYRLTIPNRGHRRFNPFGIDYHKRCSGIAAAWVQKWYVLSDEEGHSTTTDYFGESKHMQGFQIGVPVQWMCGYGLGFNTGLYFEGYFLNDGYDLSLEELGLYMPIDFQFRLPLGEEFSIFAQGGIGIDWSIQMKLREDGYDDSLSLDYDEDGMPNHFNFSGEFGGGIQYKAMQLTAMYQIGLNNNSNMVYEGYYSKLRKLAIQFSLVF